jgi:TonB-linked SusC/RagA family outer membrane protein
MHFKVLFCRQARKSSHGITKTLLGMRSIPTRRETSHCTNSKIIVLAMKLTFFFMMAACLQVSAGTYSQTVSFSGRNVPLEKVFAAVEKQTGYVFFFDESILKEARPVTISAENYSLSLFLSRVLEDQPFKFSFQNKTIVISRKAQAPLGPLLPEDTAQNTARPFQGVVVDANGTPLAGASVTVKATGKSTITNGRGVFTTLVPPGKTKIVVSFVGYNTREIELEANQQSLMIQMTVAVNVLDEEVVQAYGKTNQRLAVGSIVKVSGEEIQKQPVMNPLLALNGRVPGLLISPISGYVSAPVRTEIRGRNTISPDLVSDPLYVIDGMPLTILEVNVSFNRSNYKNGSTGFVQAGLASNTQGQSPLFSMNPADIESITVLKDAAATAIYGSRGANGVILITTKRAKPGKTRLGINVQQSISTAPRHWDMLNTSEYLQMRREALKNDGIPVNVNSLPELAWDTTRSVDWQKEIWGVAKSTDANITLSGGDQRTSFTLGAGYTNTQDITTISGTNQRINISSGITHRSQDQKLSVDFKANYSYTNVKAINMPSLVTLPPNFPSIFDSKGALNYAAWNAAGLNSVPTATFPFASVLTPTTANTNFLTGILRINYYIARGLNFAVMGGYNHANTRTAGYAPIASQNPLANAQGSANFGYSTVSNWNIEPELSYTFYIGAAKIDAMAGGTWQSSMTRATTFAGFGYTNDALLGSITGAAGSSSGESFAQKKYLNAHARINANWQNKYILELTGNRDGSSIFGPGRQFGNFWSVGAGWIISEEAWMQSVMPSWWSFFKLNASYGVTGLDAGGSYKYLSLWSVPSNNNGYPPYNGVTPLSPTHAVNQDYQWQENRKINADLSLGFLKDRINLTVTYYENRCNNQLTSIPTPYYTGFSSVTGNSPANVLNNGWEGMINARVVDNKTFSWNLGFNISVNRNKLVSYPDFQFSPYYTSKKIGQSLNTEYVFHYLGLNPQNGRRTYADYNHDGLVTGNSSVPPATGNDDKYIALDITPEYSGGITSQFTYKRFSLSLFFLYKKQLGQLHYKDLPGSMGNIPQDVYQDHWQQPGDQTTYTRFSTFIFTNDANFARSDAFYTDASFLRLNNLSFSYSLPDRICKKAHMQGASLSVNIQNLFTITPYKGIEPETSFGTMPQPRVMAAKVSFNF